MVYLMIPATAVLGYAAIPAQLTLFGQPWWVWLIVLLVVIVLVCLLFRKPREEKPPFIVEESESKSEEPSLPVSPFAAELRKPDDLTIIEGIGPRINGVLRLAGMETYWKIAEATPEEISEILSTAGIRMIDATTWPEQARLAAAGRWDELKALQDQLKGGREA